MSVEKQVTEGEEPVSPFSRLFSLPGLDVFNIITIGCKTEGDRSSIEQINLNLFKVRFSSDRRNLSTNSTKIETPWSNWRESKSKTGTCNQRLLQRLDKTLLRTESFVERKESMWQSNWSGKSFLSELLLLISSELLCFSSTVGSKCRYMQTRGVNFEKNGLITLIG